MSVSGSYRGYALPIPEIPEGAHYADPVELGCDPAWIFCYIDHDVDPWPDNRRD